MMQSEWLSALTCCIAWEEMLTEQPWTWLRLVSLHFPISQARCFARDVEVGKRICWLTCSWFTHYIFFVVFATFIADRHMRWTLFFFPNIHCYCLLLLLLLWKWASLPGVFCTESHWLKPLAMQPELLAEQDTVPTSLLLNFVCTSCEHKEKKASSSSFLS